MPGSKTGSTSILETEQGTHVLDIVGYSQHRGIGVDKSILSGGFSVGGHTWHIVFYPDGISSDEGDLVAVGLVLLSKNVKVRASFELRLINQTTGSPEPWYNLAPRVFSGDISGCSRIFTIKRSSFESSTYLWDDRLTIDCIVTVFKQPSVPKTKSFPKIEVPPSDITEQFVKLLEEKEGVDVNLSVKGENFAAHKIVLAARSPVFRAELYGPMREAGRKPIVIKDVQPDVFRALLHFIYTDSLPPLDDLQADDHTEMIRHLLVAADRYAMERLKLMCQSILCENLRVQTVASTLALADQHNCDMLKDACIEFITCSNALGAVSATVGYKNLKRTCPSVVIEAFEKSCKFRKA